LDQRGAVKNKMTKVTCICRGPKKSSYLLHFIFIFISPIDFFNRVFGVSSQGEFKNTGGGGGDQTKTSPSDISGLWAHHKKCGGFFLRFPFFPLPRFSVLGCLTPCCLSCLLFVVCGARTWHDMGHGARPQLLGVVGSKDTGGQWAVVGKDFWPCYFFEP
jgi:hypothetical protein